MKIPPTPTWDGTTRYQTLSQAAARARRELADAAREHQWRVVFEILREYPDFTNCARPEGRAGYAPLHHAAYAGAPMRVVRRLLALGAWSTLENARGERPVDVAIRRGKTRIVPLLEPVLRHTYPPRALQEVERHFHELILARAEDMVEQEQLRLPVLTPLLELEHPKIWFPVPGMYGGFSYWLDTGARGLELVVESWCRVVGGSGQRHRITRKGTTLEEEGVV